MEAKAVQASQFVAKHGSCYYKQFLKQNKQELSKQLFYTRLASIPGRYESLLKELDGVQNI